MTTGPLVSNRPFEIMRIVFIILYFALLIIIIIYWYLEDYKLKVHNYRLNAVCACSVNKCAKIIMPVIKFKHVTSVSSEDTVSIIIIL